MRPRLLVPFALLLAVLAVCAASLAPTIAPAASGREFSTSVLLHGKSLELHIAMPHTPVASHVAVLYASGDGGWFGTAVDMFRQIARAGYPAVGFSSRAFLKIARPRGRLVNAAQLAAEYDIILTQARTALGLDPASKVVLTGWSRGAAFAVLVASEHAAQDRLAGVVAIGLAEGEDLDIDSAADETDEGQAAPGQRWPFDTYARTGAIDPLPCAVIQATHDNYLPSATARRLFGPDTPVRRLYAIEAKNHRFSGGKAAFDTALQDALHWIVAPAAMPASPQAP